MFLEEAHESHLAKGAGRDRLVHVARTSIPHQGPRPLPAERRARGPARGYECVTASQGLVLDHAEVGAIDPVRVADFEAAKTEVIGENENAMFTSAGDQGPVQAVERDYPFSMRSRISAWLMESSPSRSRVSPSA